MGQVTKRGVDADAATEQDLNTYRQAQAQLDQMRIPVLLPADNPHARLYIAALDGTGNSNINDKPENWSVVAKTYAQILALEDQKITNITGGYVEGTFTQEGMLRTPSRLLDGRYGHSFDERVETAYYDFCVQARNWLIEDPQAQIRVAGVGFSRGAEEVTALQRMIEERGIRDPEGAMVKPDRDGVIQKIEYADRPLLVAPGKTLQAALLLDPVATGVEDEERALPASNLGTFEISALHERRNLFKDNDHVPPGFSEDNRNLNVSVAGAHSDIGNTYTKNGLGVLSFNLGVEFLNRLSDQPFLQKQPVPTDPAQFVMHRSEQGMMGLYGTRSYDSDGARDHVQDQSPRPGTQGKEPISPELEAQVERRTVPAPPGRGSQGKDENRQQDMEPERPRHDRNESKETPFLDSIIGRLYQGAIDKDDKAMNAAANDYLRSPLGQQFQVAIAQRQQAMTAQEQQVAFDAQQALAQQQESMRNPHVMRM